MDQQSILENQPSNRYAFNGEMLVISAICTIFLFVVLLVGLHLYARWYLRRAAASRRTRILVFADNHRPGSAADRGLDPSVLASLPVLHFSSKAADLELESEQDSDPEQRRSLECAVCISEFEEGEIVRLLPKCNHSFHIECIDMWFHSHSTCPLCRSPIEPAAAEAEPSPVVVVVEVAEGVGSSEPGSSSGSGLCDTCQHHEGNVNENAVGDSATSLVRRRKADVKIEVGPPRRAELENELAQSSPMGRLLSFKRLLSMGRRSPAGGSMRSPVGGGMKSPYGPGPSRGPTDLDLESGLGTDCARAHTPK